MRVYDFVGEVLVVTGGASGIGAGICASFANAGGTAICVDLETSDGEELANSYSGPGQIKNLSLDVRDGDAVVKVTELIIDRYGHIDGLVLSAAVQPRIDVEDMTDSDWARVIDTNLTGVFYFARAVVPHMKGRQKGSIVTFSSGLALQGWASTSAYAATKAGLIGFTKSLAREMLPFYVRANVVHPGITDSPLFTGTKTSEEMEYFKRTDGAMGTVDDVAQMLMFLLSEESSSWTGLFISRDLIFPQRSS